MAPVTPPRRSAAVTASAIPPQRRFRFRGRRPPPWPSWTSIAGSLLRFDRESLEETPAKHPLPGTGFRDVKRALYSSRRDARNFSPAVILPVPVTPQAPLGNWAARQHTCEEASLVMVDRYLHGDHSGGLIDAHTADAAINQITTWKPAQDLTTQQVGEVAQKYMGWAYKVLPATRLNMKQQLSLGRPLIVGVRTHGLGNPNYPGYSSHYEQAGYSVSHYLVVAGYDDKDTYVLNDPGLTRGH